MPKLAEWYWRGKQSTSSFVLSFRRHLHTDRVKTKSRKISAKCSQKAPDTCRTLGQRAFSPQSMMPYICCRLPDLHYLLLDLILSVFLQLLLYSRRISMTVLLPTNKTSNALVFSLAGPLLSLTNTAPFAWRQAISAWLDSGHVGDLE